MFALFKKAVKDCATMANGEDFCIAGIATLIATLLGFGIMVYVFVVIRPHAMADVSDFLKSFAIYHGSVLTAGCTGKYINNQAEPNSPPGGA